MNLSEINWDFNEAGTWPLPIRAIVIVIVCALVVGLGIYYDITDQLAQLESIEQKEVELRKSFEVKQKKAVNLQDYKDQLEQIELSLAEMIKQMPSKSEVANLLVDISQTGLVAGLEFRLFKPAPPIKRDFYWELPINIQVVGQYEELGLFISGLASLPRIVTAHNVKITPIPSKEKGKNAAESRDMIMDVLVKTYNEGSDTDATPKKDNKRGRK